MAIRSTRPDAPRVLTPDPAARPGGAAPTTPPRGTSTDGGAPDSVDRARVERPFDVYFTPIDDAYRYEAQCIDEVIAARRADPNTYPPDQNPFRILYMVFNLRNQEICEKLFEAVEAGVEVQVLVEADQISDARPWNKVDEWFEQRGLKVVKSDRGIDPADLEKAHLIGIDKRSLMHMKSRIFRYRDPDSGEPVSKVLSGSLNPGGTPVTNDENVNVMVDGDIVDRYEKRFYEIREHKQARNVWSDTVPVNVLFTPYAQGGPTPTQKLFDWIDQEQEMILISVFALRDLKAKGVRETLIDKLKKAMARGVTVAVITDRRKSDGLDEQGNRVMMYGRPAHDDPTDEAMERAGIPLYELVNTANPFSAVHGKSVICGLTDMKVMTGAGNWTIAAMGSDDQNPRNEESYIFVESGRLDDNYTGRAYLENFLYLLRKYDGQYDKPAEQVIRELQRQPAWPKVQVDLTPVALAHPGQEVYLVSDHPSVQALTPAGSPGVPIDTAPSSHAPPFRPPDPIELPFGTLLSYRVAVRDPDTHELKLEPGDQILVVDAPGHRK